MRGQILEHIEAHDGAVMLLRILALLITRDSFERLSARRRFASNAHRTRWALHVVTRTLVQRDVRMRCL